MSRLNRDWVAGVSLLVAGFILLGGRLFPDLVPIVPLILGLAVLGVFLVTRAPGALVNGAVTVGIGVGVLVVKGGTPDFGAAGFIVSVAGGFYLVWLLGLVFEIASVRWWPVVPGSVLLAIGAVVYTAKMGEPLLRFAVDWWPAWLVAVGIYLLIHARLNRRLADDDETSSVPVTLGADSAPGAAPSHPHPAVAASAQRPISDATGGQLGGDRPGSVEQT